MYNILNNKIDFLKFCLTIFYPIVPLSYPKFQAIPTSRVGLPIAVL